MSESIFSRAMFFGAALVLSFPAAAQNAAPGVAPDGAQRTYLSANGLLGRGMYELAADEYRAFLDAAPGHEKADTARYGLSVCLVRLKDYDSAAPELARLRDLKSFEFAPEVGLLSAQCELAREHFGDAARLAERALAAYAQSPVADDAAAILAEARYRSGDHAGARAAADTLADSWPESPARPRTELVWGLAAIAMGDDGPAADRLDRLADSDAPPGIVSRAMLLSAQARHRLGDREAAAATYERLLDRPVSPETPEALLGLGMMLRERGLLEDSGRTLDRVQAEFPTSSAAAPALMERGRVWLDSGQVDRAQTAFNRAIESGVVPGDQAAYWLARCELRSGNARSAADRLGQAITEFPESPLSAELRFDYAVSLVRAGDDRAAIPALEEFAARFRAHPLAPGALHMQAGAEHRLGNYPASRALCAEFLRDHAAHADAPEVRFLAAENDLLAGDLQAARAGYADVVAADPPPPLADKSTFRLGTVLYQLGRAEEAQPHLARVTDGRRTRPEFLSALLCLGDARFQAGRWADAEKALTDYLAVATESADDALLKLGLCAQRQGRPADAIARFDDLLSRFPASPLAVHAMFEKGQSLRALGKAEAARTLFAEVLSRDPGGPLSGPAESHLGALAMAAGDTSAGADHFARAAAATTDSESGGEALFQRAQALLAAGRFEEAAEGFAQVPANFPGHARARVAAAQRAIALRRAGRPAEAIEAARSVPGTAGANLDPAMTTALRYEEAKALHELDRVPDATAAYQDVIDGGQGLLTLYALIELAAIHSTAGDDAAAGPLLARARESASSGDVPASLRHEIDFRLAANRFTLEKPADAVKLLGPVIDAPPAPALLAPALNLRAQSLTALGRHAQAAADFERLTREFPEDAAAAENMLGLGESLSAAQDWPGSERALEAFLQRFSAHELWFRARFGLGWARENQSRHEAAIADYAAVVAGHQGPTAARSQFQIGECLFALGRHEEAARELLKVDILYAYPEWSAAALYEAGRCFKELGQAERARAQFSAVVEQHAATEWARLAGRELASLDRPVPARSGR